ncbi:MAG: hypothetical protein HZC04_01425, partial [Candidatus Lloydbacteria bacterium]|nr:hypothetical protein [Candidatus Lloydbacteria bacterium]
MTGYSKDYIGQLCRSGKFPGKVFKHKRFVEEESLFEHAQKVGGIEIQKPRSSVFSGIKTYLQNLKIKRPKISPASSARVSQQTPEIPQEKHLEKRIEHEPDENLHLPPLKKNFSKPDDNTYTSVDDVWGKVSYKEELRPLTKTHAQNLNLEKNSGTSGSFHLGARRAFLSKILLAISGTTLFVGGYLFSNSSLAYRLTSTLDSLIPKIQHVPIAGIQTYSASFQTISLVSDFLSSKENLAALFSVQDALDIVPNALSFASRSIYRTLSPFFEETKQAIVRSLERTSTPSVVTTEPPPLATAQKQEQVIGNLQTEISNLKATLRSIGTNTTPSTRIVYEKPITQITQFGLTDAELQTKLEQYNNKLVAMINDVSSRGDTA